MILHYYSARGALLAALNIGIVKNVAKHFFNLKIDMNKLATQDVDDSTFTTWRIIILGPYNLEMDADSKPVMSSTFHADSKLDTKYDSDVKSCPFSHK